MTERPEPSPVSYPTSSGMLLENEHVTEMLVPNGSGVFEIIGRAYASAEGGFQVQRWFFDGTTDLSTLLERCPPHKEARWRKVTTGEWNLHHNKQAFIDKAFSRLAQGIYCKANCREENVSGLPQALTAPPPFLDPATTLPFQDDTGTSRIDFDGVLAGMVTTYLPSPGEALEWRFLLPSYETPITKAVQIKQFVDGQQLADIFNGLNRIVTSACRYYSGTADITSKSMM
jgi:hypothetical protein